MPLHPESSMFLRAQSLRGLTPWEEMEPTDARRVFKSLMNLFGPREDIARVEDIELSEGVAMRLYHPQPGTPLPVFVYYHGGGWVVGNCDTHDSLCRQVADFAQLAVLSVDYRLAPEHPFPTPLDDCFAAVQWVIDHGASYELDPFRLAVGGDSAGGNLAAAVALRAREENGPDLRAQVLIYPVIEPNFESRSYREYATGLNLTKNTMQWFWDQYVPKADTRRDPWVVPSSAESLADLPPCLTILAECDVLRDEGAMYAQRLADAGVDVTTTEYEGLLHGFVQLASPFTRATEAREEIAQFLRKQLAN